jgi:hypothetical protein
MLNLRSIAWSCLALVMLGGPTSAAERVPGPPKISITPPKLPSVSRVPPPKSPSPTTTGPTSGGARLPPGDRPNQPGARPADRPGQASRDSAPTTLPKVPISPAASPMATEPAASRTLTPAISGGGGLEGAVVQGGGGLSSAVTSQP